MSRKELYAHPFSNSKACPSVARPLWFEAFAGEKHNADQRVIA